MQNVGRNARKFEFGESTGQLGLKMMIRTHTDEKKMVQLYYLEPGCVISMFKFIFINLVDQYQYLGNCAPTPPLTQYVIIS